MCMENTLHVYVARRAIIWHKKLMDDITLEYMDELLVLWTHLWVAHEMNQHG